MFKDSSWQLRINIGELNDFFGWFFKVMWKMSKTWSRWWFQIFFICTPTWGNDPI